VSNTIPAGEVELGATLDLGRAGIAYVERIDTRPDGRLTIRWRRRQRTYRDGWHIDNGVMLGSLAPRHPGELVRILDNDPEPGPDE
jgi:hypothetical protein